MSSESQTKAFIHRLERIAAQMSYGRIIVGSYRAVHGGLGMQGGVLHIYGQADCYVGAEMRDGRLYDKGDVLHVLKTHPS
jgi:formylmethanofuran dehydrogenase subunit C